MTMKNSLEMKNRPHRYDINRPRPRHGHKYAKYKMYLSIMMVMYQATPEQHLELYS